MLLTILIPTRSRASFLKACLDSVVRSIDQANARGEVEVVVVDNFSQDDTQEVVAGFAGRGDVVYRKHKTPAATAEESLCQAVPFANGEFVWSLGDDDIVVENAIERVVRLISTSSFDFVLLNLFAKVGERLHTYFRVPYPTVTYVHGIDLFRDLGLISATTTISCLCFRKSVLSQVDWAGLMRISSIYSHSVAFFLAFHDRPCALLEDPCVIYKQNTLQEVRSRISGMARTSGNPALHPFTTGLIRLINEAARYLRMPVGEIARFEEIELRKVVFTVFNTTTGAFIARMVIDQLIMAVEGQDSGFSAADLAAILQFFSELGDSWSLTTIRCAIAVATAADKRCDERVGILKGYLDAIAGIEHETFAAATMVPGSWRKACFLFSSGVPFKTGRGVPGDAFGRPSAWAGENGTRLTILIPSFHRARRLAQQLRSLYRLGVQDVPGIEVLVADNHSTDRTVQVCRAAAKLLPNLKAIHYDVHLPSGEENVNRAVVEAKGDYVWLLGDDDVVVRPAFFLLLNLVWHCQEPCFVFNSLAISTSERATRNKLIENICGNGQINLVEPLTRCTLESLVKRFGLTTSLAFISRYVLRRSDLRSFDHYIRVSPIYSHVFGLLESFAGKQVTFVNYPIVHRKPSSEAGFKRLGTLRQQPYYFPWTTGLVRLAKAAAERGVVEECFLGDVHELNGDCSYELQLEIKIQFIRQLILYCESREKVELPSVSNFEELFGYFGNDGRKPEWTGCCVFLSYLKLHEIESLWGIAADRCAWPLGALLTVRDNLRGLIAELVSPVPPAPLPQPPVDLPLPVVSLPQPALQRFAGLKRVARRVLGQQTSRLLGKAYRKAASLAGGLLPPL